MPRRYAGLVVASDVLFDDLPSASGPADITIRRGSIPADAWTFVHNWSDDRGDHLTIERGPAGYRLTLPALQCVLSADGGAITFDPPPGLADAELAHVLLHQILPLALCRRGRFVLHACAVETDRGVIGLLGVSGAGKSTLAAAFCAAGCRLVADDTLAIEVTGDGVHVSPTADGLRLWEHMALELQSPGEASDPRRKRRVPAPLAAADMPLVRLFLLGEGVPEPAHTVAVSPAQARVEVLSHVFRLDVSDTGETRRLFDMAHRIAERVPVRRLEYPDGVEFLGSAVRAALRDFETP